MRESPGYTDIRWGSVTFVQRFGSALNLNPHFHVLMLDGVYVIGAEGAAPEFVPVPALQDSDVQRIVELAAHRLVRSLQQWVRSHLKTIQLGASFDQ